MNVCITKRLSVFHTRSFRMNREYTLFCLISSPKDVNSLVGYGGGNGVVNVGPEAEQRTYLIKNRGVSLRNFVKTLYTIFYRALYYSAATRKQQKILSITEYSSFANPETMTPVTFLPEYSRRMC